ncbi:MAG: hypothetical protein IPL15_10720 [Comamonadaceae bacterium]|uniref:hypothetical protein n=1 Tax=Candidatus Skiveiella danica TaxID=3386177 RepID=UPI00390AAD57|nr:hypothetical protein [Comamonadaceae bacterium]
MIKAFLQNLVTAASLCCFAEHVNAEKGRHYPIKTSDDKDALDFLNQITASKSQNAQIVKPRVEQQPVRGPNGSDIDRFLPRKMDYTSLTETLPPPKLRAAIDKITEQAEQKIAPRVEAELEKIWNAPGSTLQAKKQKLFDYWQYLSIFLQPIVFRFIDRHLPQGSASEYTKEELFLYQKEGFFPYGKQRQ